MRKNYDVIIIGAGIGGLIAGTILAKEGKGVLILEKNSVAGGYAVNFKRKKFEFNVSFHMLNGCNKEGLLYNVLKDCGVVNKCNFIRPRNLYRSVWPDYDIKIPQKGVKSYIKYLSGYFPKEKNNIKNLFETISKISISPGLGAGGEKSVSELLCYFDMVFTDIADQYLSDYRIKALIPQVWGLFGSVPDKISVVYFLHGFFDFICNGSHYLKGGGRRIADILVDSIRENNGSVIFDKEVKRIIIRNKKAEGVILRDDVKFLSNDIISNIDAHKTFSSLVGSEHLGKGFVKKINRMTASISAFTVFLGLNCDLRNKGISDYLIFVNPDYDPNRQYQAALDNEFNGVFMLLTLHSSIEPDYAPKGKFSMSIFVLSGYDFWQNLTKKEYKKKKEELSNILIKRAERVIPGLSGFIEVKSIATPITMERYTGSHKGAIYGWEHTSSQSFFGRLKPESPIKNLYMAGAWTYPGAGIQAAMFSGVNAAKLVLNNEK